MRHHGADRNRIAVDGDLLQCFDAVEVDETARTRHAQGQDGQQGLAPGERPRDLREEKPLLADVYLALPEELDPRIPELARTLTAGAVSDEERAARLREFLLGSFEYTLTQPNSYNFV